MRAPVVIVLLSAALTACGRTPDDQKPAPAAKAAATDVQLSPAAQQDAQIEVAPAAADDQPDTQRVPGRIALAESRSWRVGIRTDGLVVAVYAELGDYVRKDQLLARYHADEVRDSRALYGAARANLARAESAEAQARRNLERHETLLELKAASQVQVDQARQDLATASTSVRNAAIEVDRLKDLIREHGKWVDPAPAPMEAAV